jgi:hypothetical protein
VPRALKGLLTVAVTLLALGGGAALIWRIVDVSGRAARGEDPPAPAPGETQPEPTEAQTGRVRGIVLKYFDPETGRLDLVVRAARGNTSGGTCTLEEVELEQFGDGTRGKILAAGKTGTYDRVTGSGRLAGDVIARRIPPGKKEADLVIRGESLNWSTAAETLTSDDYVEAVWHDRARGRTLSARGRGLRAERWTRSVRLEGDTCVSFSGAAVPEGIGFTDGKDRKKPALQVKKGRTTTVVTSVGPASVVHAAAPGLHRIRFKREVVVRSRELGGANREARMSCDSLTLWTREAGPLGAGAAGSDLPALSSAAAAPALLPTASRWLVSALRPDPARGGRAVRRPPGGEKDADRVDLVIARGAVKLRARGGEARGELAWFDGPAGILWLEGTPEEPAEVVRGERKEQMTFPKFWFDAVTGDMGKSGRGRVTITIGE